MTRRASLRLAAAFLSAVRLPNRLRSSMPSLPMRRYGAMWF
jgi:hypothetical protein